ncbi:hypothetical protein SporoP37_06640 [Sporosarcina sp. P37]|uniref:hypothetical protein n=1 Tax=unclassified Sporosarcina TaxID=2647733 RepID=UPI0009BF4074|nr:MULTISPECIES: hypothetical protein [unclassified Sporosarcina]ARD47848.1 hypothetical protein SporoP33_06160 [Sporosarcina sp. P33]ARK24376.1 hypothetical protein SporoP37_06640 [Sporosarcina sp. P37]PID17456.1 hypothetical protein CSV62_13405 [Sporosarcina sp. P35]
METHVNNPETQELITRQTQEITALNQEVEELRKEVKQLRDDIELIDVFQKKPVIGADVIGVVGFYIIAALVIIGIFF